MGANFATLEPSVSENGVAIKCKFYFSGKRYLSFYSPDVGDVFIQTVQNYKALNQYTWS